MEQNRCDFITVSTVPVSVAYFFSHSVVQVVTDLIFPLTIHADIPLVMSAWWSSSKETPLTDNRTLLSLHDLHWTSGGMYAYASNVSLLEEIAFTSNGATGTSYRTGFGGTTRDLFGRGRPLLMPCMGCRRGATICCVQKRSSISFGRYKQINATWRYPVRTFSFSLNGVTSCADLSSVWNKGWDLLSSTGGKMNFASQFQFVSVVCFRWELDIEAVKDLAKQVVDVCSTELDAAKMLFTCCCWI